MDRLRQSNTKEKGRGGKGGGIKIETTIYEKKKKIKRPGSSAASLTTTTRLIKMLLFSANN